MKPILTYVVGLLVLASFATGTEAWLEVPVEKMSLIQKVEAATVTDHLAGIQRRELAKSAAMAVTPEEFAELVELFKEGYKGKGVAVSDGL